MKQTAKRTHIPEDFEVSARIIELAKENHWPDPHSEVNAFKDYHIARGTLMADWEACFRTWLRNCLKFNKASRLPSAPMAYSPTKIVKDDKPMTEEERARVQKLYR
jgi:hypothetical protein